MEREDLPGSRVPPAKTHFRSRTGRTARPYRWCSYSWATSSTERDDGLCASRVTSSGPSTPSAVACRLRLAYSTSP